jgi:hypothetical protein
MSIFDKAAFDASSFLTDDTVNRGRTMRFDKVGGVDLRAIHTTVTESSSISSSKLPVGRDIIVLVGFFDGPHENGSIIPVFSLDQVATSILGTLSDSKAVSELKRTSIFGAIVAAQMNGGTDIVLFKLGSLSELTSKESKDDQMQYIYDSMETGILDAVDNEWFAYLIPVDAPAEGYLKSDGIFLDFTQLTAFACAKAMSNGVFVQAMLSTASTNGTVLLNSESMRGKEAWQSEYCYGQQVGWIPGNDAYRFAAVPAGRALFASADHGTAFEHGLAPAVAGLATTLGDDISLAGRKLNVSKLLPVLGSTADEMSVAGFIPVGQSAAMRRSREDGALLLGDNTMAVPMSDFKQEVVLRLARRISIKLRLALEPLVGSNGMSVGAKVQDVMDSIVKAGTIRGYSTKVARDPSDPYRLRLYVEVVPFLPVKAIEINLVAGPFVL